MVRVGITYREDAYREWSNTQQMIRFVMESQGKEIYLLISFFTARGNENVSTDWTLLSINSRVQHLTHHTSFAAQFSLPMICNQTII